MAKNIVSLEKRVPELTAEEMDFVKCCLAINPEDRFSAQQLL
jgi:hypothetical protein